MKCQQSELYAAESVAPIGRVFKTEEEMQQWVDGLRDAPYWQVNYPQVRRVECYRRTHSRDGSVGWYERPNMAGVIEMAPVHMNVRVILHELAHVLASARYHSKSHDPYFARVYLELVSVFFPEGYLPLYQSFLRNDINSDVPTERLGSARRMPAGD